MEPICAEVFPGSSIDTGIDAALFRSNNIKKGIIVAGKGFFPCKIKEGPDTRPDLHFLTPINRNGARVRRNDLLTCDGIFSEVGSEEARQAEEESKFGSRQA